MTKKCRENTEYISSLQSTGLLCFRPVSSSPLLIGTSGFSYPHWSGVFYPPHIEPQDWLSHYMRHFNTVEVDRSYYRALSEETIDRWCLVTERDYPFSLKANKSITHVAKLRNVERALLKMWDQFAPLGRRLSCVLFQLPPSLKIDPALLEAFLHDIRQTQSERGVGCRIAIEFRHRSWYEPDIFSLLGENGAAVVLHDAQYQGGFVPLEQGGELLLKSGKLTITADDWWFRTKESFAYVRFNKGDALRAWQPVLEAGIERGMPFSVYCTNDEGGAAVKDAQSLQRMLGQQQSVSSLGAA